MKFLKVLPILFLVGCVWPGIDNRKQGPFDNRTMPEHKEEIKTNELKSGGSN